MFSFKLTTQGTRKKNEANNKSSTAGSNGAGRKGGGIRMMIAGKNVHKKVHERIRI